MNATEHHLAVRRTARFHTLGAIAAETREVWFVLHGHGQLSAYFIRHFAPLAGSGRLVVAPEALNRFYLEQSGWQGAGSSRVGATWMTREDRLAEIEDYIRYLDALQFEIFRTVPREQARCVLLGFSQGVATAVRWACRGRLRPDVLVLWAGTIPPELDVHDVQPLRSMKVVRVIGRQDDMAQADTIAAEDARIERLGIAAETVRFDGGHELNTEVLQQIAV